MSRRSFNILLVLMQDESFVNAGHAVYISPSGPNPIMVQVCNSGLGYYHNRTIISLSNPFMLKSILRS